MGKGDVLDRVSMADMVAEVHREVEMRKRVYIRMIDQGKMSPSEAEKRTLRMAAVLRLLEGISMTYDLLEKCGGVERASRYLEMLAKEEEIKQSGGLQ